MRRALGSVLALALAGCSIVWAPDRDAIVPDLDGGMDGAVDADLDAGDGRVPDDAGDGGDGGNCPGGGTEICDNGEDDDCDGRIDCFDSDCLNESVCCGSTVGWPESMDFSYPVWTQMPSTAPAGDVDRTSGRISDFGPLGALRGVVYEGGCVPIALGLDLDVDFVIDTPCTDCDDFAALALTPARDMTDGQRLTSDLEVVITARGDAYVAYVVDGVEHEVPDSRRTGLGGSEEIGVHVELRPSVDDAGRAVILTTVEIAQTGWIGDGVLVDAEPLLLQDQLLGGGVCPAFEGIEGLLVAFEGMDDGVQVDSPLVANQRECSNPSYFEPLAIEAYETVLTDCNPAQLGEPSLATYCVDCGGTGRFWELWVDSTDTERVDLIGDRPDFFVCGARSPFLASAWTARTDGMPPGTPTPPVIPAPTDLSVREPFVYTSGDVGADADLVVAWAQRTAPSTEEHELWVGVVRATFPNDPVSGQRVLGASTLADCESLRDPALVPRGPDPYSDGFYLLFTCEGVGTAPSSIGVAALRWPAGGGLLELDPGYTPRDDVLTRSIGSYAFLGPTAPEPIAEIDGADLRVRMWFLARSGGGEVTLGYAEGEGPFADGDLPALSPYPGNPILAADDPVLGTTPACTHGCSFNGVGVAATRDRFNLAIGRTVLGPGANTHQIVGLEQRRPTL